MLQRFHILLLTVLLSVAFALPALSQAQETGFKVDRFVIAKKVVDREPVGVSAGFSSKTRKVYCFLEAKDIAKDTEVAMVWFYEDEESALVTLLLKEGDRWRTHSSKLLDRRKGNWRVELQDEHGKVISTARFTVK